MLLMVCLITACGICAHERGRISDSCLDFEMLYPINFTQVQWDSCQENAVEEDRHQFRENFEYLVSKLGTSIFINKNKICTNSSLKGCHNVIDNITARHFSNYDWINLCLDLSPDILQTHRCLLLLCKLKRDLSLNKTELHSMPSFEDPLPTLNGLQLDLIEKLDMKDDLTRQTP